MNTKTMNNKPRLEYRPLASLTPYANNPRKNNKAVDALVESIKTFGFRVPIVIDRDGVIVAGHTRYKAAKRLKKKLVPCIIADELTPEQIKAFRLIDNRTGELATWIDDKLQEEILKIDGIDMSFFGFFIDTGAEDDEETEADYTTESDFKYESEYGVIVILDGPEEQDTVLRQLESEGYDVKAVTV